MLQAPCPRCGEPSGDELCGRCTAYLLRFDPFLLRPGLPGPSVDREVRPGVALLALDPEAPLRIAPPSERDGDEAFEDQFLKHLGLPDGGRAVLTRGDRAVLHRMIRGWAHAPPQEDTRRTRISRLFAEAAALAEMPTPMAAHFQSLAGMPEALTEPPELDAEPEPREPLVLGPPEPVAEPPPLEPPVAPPPPPPTPEEPTPEEWEALDERKAEVAAQREELAQWVEGQEAMERREGEVAEQLAEIRRREGAIAEKERAIAEEERQLQEQSEKVRQQAAKAAEAEDKRRLFFLLFSMEGMSRHAARALADAFVTEETIRNASVEDLAAVPGVLPEQAALIRDAFTSGAQPERRDLRDKAQEMLEEGEEQAALEVFEEIVRENPEDAEAWFNRGEMYTSLDRRDEAIASYERVLALEPDHRPALAELANLLFEQGEYGLAASSLQDLLKRAPEQTNHWLFRATSLLETGKSTEATLIYNAVLEADPDNLPANLALGDLLLAMGDTARADRQYSQAVQKHPDSPDALLKKGLLLNRQGRWGAAIQFFNRAISVRWDHLEAWAAKGQVLLAQGKPRDALEAFDKLLTFDEDRYDGWLGKAEAHLALGENDKAAEAAGRALSLNEEGQDVQELLERLRESADRPPVEPVEVASLPPKDTFDRGVLSEMAMALLEAGDAVAAARGFDEILTMSEKDARAWFGKGRALHALDRYEEALECFRTAHELDPEDEECARWLAVCEERVGKEES